jgi:hypothetical protein
MTIDGVARVGGVTRRAGWLADASTDAPRIDAEAPADMGALRARLLTSMLG